MSEDDKAPRPDRQSLLRAQDERVRREMYRALRSLSRFGQSPAFQQVARQLRALHEKGVIPKVTELVDPRNETEEKRNAWLDEQWRRMQETEEERNARLDERWRWLQEETKAQEEPPPQPAASPPTQSAASTPAQLLPPPAKHGPGAPFLDISHLDDALVDLKAAFEKQPHMPPKQQRDRVIKFLREHDVEFDEEKQAKTLDRRISNWRKFGDWRKSKP